MTLPSSIFRRGGPKKELFTSDGRVVFEVEEDDDKEHLRKELERLLEVLQAPKTGSVLLLP